LSTESTTTHQETARAAQAFADYVAMGPTRSLEALAERYRTASKTIPTKRIATLKDWSVKYRWQARIAEAISAETEHKLHLASELDADTFLKTSLLMNSTIDRVIAQEILIDPVESIKIRETVRRPQAKGATSVNVHLDVQISQLIEQIAQEDGLNDVERRQLEADVQKYLAVKPA
jgi:hypothetical protein